MSDAILAIMIVLPAILTYFLKANAALAYLGLCGGYVISIMAGSDIDDSLNKVNNVNINSSEITILILVLSLLLTLFFSGRSWSGQSKMIMQLVAAVAAGLSLSIMAAPYINSVINVNLYSSSVWPLIQHGRGTIIVAGTIYSLLVVWFSKTHHPDKKHK
jgi:hypothetical protein